MPIVQVWVFALLRGYQVTRALAGGAVDSMYIACFPTTKAQVFKRSFPLVFGEVEVLLLVRYTTLSSKYYCTSHFGWFEGSVLDEVDHERLPFIAVPKSREKHTLRLLPRRFSRGMKSIDADILVAEPLTVSRSTSST